MVGTAVHQFQVLSVLEAASAGARPLVPDALCYPEQYPGEYRYDPDDPKALVERLAGWLTEALPDPVEPKDWLASSLSSKWAALLNNMAGVPDVSP